MASEGLASTAASRLLLVPGSPWNRASSSDKDAAWTAIPGRTIKWTMADFDRPPRVLVVEDDDAIAQVLQRSLRMEGYDVRIAGDGIGALDLAHAFLPDLVILDLGLPGLDGIDVAKTLREGDDDVPILVLTARDAVES